MEQIDRKFGVVLLALNDAFWCMVDAVVGSSPQYLLQ